MFYWFNAVFLLFFNAKLFLFVLNKLERYIFLKRNLFCLRFEFIYAWDV